MIREAFCWLITSAALDCLLFSQAIRAISSLNQHLSQGAIYFVCSQIQMIWAHAPRSFDRRSLLFIKIMIVRRSHVPKLAPFPTRVRIKKTLQFQRSFQRTSEAKVELELVKKRIRRIPASFCFITFRRKRSVSRPKLRGNICQTKHSHVTTHVKHFPHHRIRLVPRHFSHKTLFRRHNRKKIVEQVPDRARMINGEIMVLELNH